jgi:hypothetical protein
VASEKIQDSPKRRTPSVRSSGFGTDKEAPSEEAKLPKECVPRSFTELGKILMTRRLPF